MQFFTHKYTHKHTLKQMINTHMNTHTVSSENHLAPTFFSLWWCRLNSFASCCCPLLNLLVLTPQFLGKTQKFQVRVCAYSFTLLLLLLTLPKTYSFDISKFEYTILNYSLFSLSTRKTIYVYHICYRVLRRSSSNIYLPFLLQKNFFFVY